MRIFGKSIKNGICTQFCGARRKNPITLLGRLLGYTVYTYTEVKVSNKHIAITMYVLSTFLMFHS